MVQINIIFYQTGYNLHTLRQASRRSWRLSQTADQIRVYFMHYRKSIQEQTVSLIKYPSPHSKH